MFRANCFNGVNIWIVLMGLLGVSLHAETIALNFKWPSTLNARVVERRTEITGAGPMVSSISMDATYNMSVRRNRYGYIVQTTTPDVLITGIKDPVMQSIAQNLVRATDRSFGNGLISVTGNLTFPDFSNRIKRSRESALKLLDGVPVEMRSSVNYLVDELFDPKPMMSAIRSQWAKMIGNWHKTNIEVGTWYQASGNDYVQSAGTELPIDVYFNLTSRVPCQPGSSDRNCVLIECRSIPKSEAFSKAMAEYLATHLGVNGTVDCRMSDTVSLVTDPRTLQPYFFHETIETQCGAVQKLVRLSGTYTYK
ncbi:hypothetical protein EBR96_04240 [bacterium]|nr:hypothetical protein [bacterium]